MVFSAQPRKNIPAQHKSVARGGDREKGRERELLQKLSDRSDPDSKEAAGLNINLAPWSEPEVWSLLTDKTHMIC